jgi:hypothetical protein
MKNYCITHEYVGTQPIVNSRHKTLEAAQAKYGRSLRSFRRANSSTFPSRAIFPHAIREEIDGKIGEKQPTE